MLEEVQKLCVMLEQELEGKKVNKEGERLMELALKMNISIVNALWVLLVGEKLELNDERLTTIVKVDKLTLRYMRIHVSQPGIQLPRSVVLNLLGFKSRLKTNFDITIAVKNYVLVLVKCVFNHDFLIQNTKVWLELHFQSFFFD